jgi:hypothetical protein
MNWLVFVGGFLSGFLAAGVITYMLWARVGYRHIRVPQTVPRTVRSVVGLQPFVKELMNFGSDQDGLYIRFANSRFLVRVRKRQFKREPDAIEIEVRNSDFNSAHYSAVKAGFDSGDISYRERFTPKQKKPKDMRARIDIGTFAPAAVGAVLKEIARSLGEKDGDKILVSSHDPAYWKTTP